MPKRSGVFAFASIRRHSLCTVWTRLQAKHASACRSRPGVRRRLESRAMHTACTRYGTITGNILVRRGRRFRETVITGAQAPLSLPRARAVFVTNMLRKHVRCNINERNEKTKTHVRVFSFRTRLGDPLKQTVFLYNCACIVLNGVENIRPRANGENDVPAQCVETHISDGRPCNICFGYFCFCFFHCI